MNDYYKSKYLQKNIEGSDRVFVSNGGLGGSIVDPEKQPIIIHMRQVSELITDSISDRYDDLIPNEGDIYQNSIQFLTVIDLLSEGPIEGFVDELGRATSNPLEALYLDDVVVKPTSRVRKYVSSKLLNAESALVDLDPSDVPDAINYFNFNNT